MCSLPRHNDTRTVSLREVSSSSPNTTPTLFSAKHCLSRVCYSTSQTVANAALSSSLRRDPSAPDQRQWTVKVKTTPYSDSLSYSALICVLLPQTSVHCVSLRYGIVYHNTRNINTHSLQPRVKAIVTIETVAAHIAVSPHCGYFLCIVCTILQWATILSIVVTYYTTQCWGCRDTYTAMVISSDWYA